MYAAMPLPQNDFALLKLLLRAAAQFVRVRIPHRHVVIGDAHAEGRVATQMLIGKEHHPTRAGERPLDRRLRIARRADDATVATDKRFETCSRVNVRYRRDVARVEYLVQLLPGVFDLV